MLFILTLVLIYASNFNVADGNRNRQPMPQPYRYPYNYGYTYTNTNVNRQQPAQSCLGDHGGQGVCTTKADCLLKGGLIDGKCNERACCHDKFNCGGVITANGSFFANSDYPKTNIGSGSCSVKVRLLPGVAAVKLNLKVFELSPANEQGLCDRDSFEVFATQDDNLLGKICGKNNGQHAYLRVDHSRSKKHEKVHEILLTIHTSRDSGRRRWLINVQQIHFMNQFEAIPPRGCLQYRSPANGSIETFANRESLSEPNYAICFRDNQLVKKIELNIKSTLNILNLKKEKGKSSDLEVAKKDDTSNTTETGVHRVVRQANTVTLPDELYRKLVNTSQMLSDINNATLTPNERTFLQPIVLPTLPPLAPITFPTLPPISFPTLPTHAPITLPTLAPLIGNLDCKHFLSFSQIESSNSTYKVEPHVLCPTFLQNQAKLILNGPPFVIFVQSRTGTGFPMQIDYKCISC